MANPYHSSNPFVRYCADNSDELSRLGKLGAKARKAKGALAENKKLQKATVVPEPKQGLLFSKAPYPD